MAACKTQYPSPEKPHHTPDGFTNPLGHEERGLADFLKWQWGRMIREIPGPETYGFALAKNDPAFLQSNGEKSTLTWIGHATVLLQLKGRNILTDPHFSERASPVSWTGPKRAIPPGVALEDLPEIHAVLISHDHYDSLDRTTIRRLRNRPGGEHTVFFVPLGLQAWFADLGVTRVVELDWWGRHEETGLEVLAVPVQHWSKRGLIGRNRTLWAGWVVRRGGFSFFFVGDSGYTPLFKEIGRRLGPFDLTAIPIGAYEPRWFMGLHHMNPEEAVQGPPGRPLQKVGFHPLGDLCPDRRAPGRAAPQAGRGQGGPRRFGRGLPGPAARADDPAGLNPSSRRRRFACGEDPGVSSHCTWRCSFSGWPACSASCCLSLRS